MPREGDQPADAGKPGQGWRTARRDLLLLLVLGLLVYLLLPRVGEVRSALHALSHANPFGVLGSLLAAAATFLFGALALRSAAARRLPLRRTIAVQVATAFANLAPSGWGVPSPAQVAELTALMADAPRGGSAQPSGTAR